MNPKEKEKISRQRGDGVAWFLTRGKTEGEETLRDLTIA